MALGGGALAVALGVAVFGLTSLDMQLTGNFFLVAPMVGIVLLLIGAMKLGQDIVALMRPPPSQADLQQVEILFQAHLNPFFYCTECYCICESGLCIRCGRTSSCLEIMTDEDAVLAISAVGL